MADSRPTLLVLQRYFRAGFDSTGPNQSIREMIGALSDQFRFRVIAEAAEGDVAGRWTELHGIERLPLRRRPIGSAGLRRALRETPHSAILANSFFDPSLTIATLWLRRLGLIPARPMLIAPRGEFAPAGLATKRLRKRVYLRSLRMASLLRDVVMQATDEREAADIRAVLGAELPVAVTPNIRLLAPPPPHRPRRSSEPLRIVFLGRVDPIKNLDFAIDRLADAKVPATLEIFGVALDEAYWSECRRRIAALPPGISVTYHGVIPNGEVPQMLAERDLLLLPTAGENFGHAIVDSLAAGTPVLISDRTRWHGLQAAGAGWDLPLERPDLFVAAIRESAREDDAASARRRAAARRYIEQAIDTQTMVSKMADCLWSLVGGAGAVCGARVQSARESTAAGQ